MKRKMFLKRLSALLCAIVVSFGSLVGVSFYYAYEYVNRTDFVHREFDLDFVISNLPESVQGKYWVITTSTMSGYLCDIYFYDEPLEVYHSSSPTDELPVYEIRGLLKDTYSLIRVDEDYSFGRATPKKNMSFYLQQWSGNGKDGIKGTQDDIITCVLKGDIIASNHDVWGRDGFLEDFVYFSASHEFDGTKIENASSLGYLKNLTDKKQVLTDSDGVQDLSSMRKILTFDPVSTTGVDLTTGDYVIRVYGQMAFVKNGTNEIVNEDFPLVHYADFDARDCRVVYNYQELFDLVSKSAENPYNLFDTIFGQITRSDNVYFQIYNKTTGKFGGYVKSYLGMTSNMEEESLYTTVDNELNVDDTGYVDYDAPSSGGSGTTWEDAELDDEYIGTSNEDLKDFESTLNVFTSTLGAVPKAIGVVFSFLPSWCLGIIALSFASFGIIALFKFIRG